MLSSQPLLVITVLLAVSFGKKKFYSIGPLEMPIPTPIQDLVAASAGVHLSETDRA